MLDLCLYISSHLFLCQKALQTSISKRERVEKALLQKLVWLGKGRAKMYSKCVVLKPKAYSSKKYQKVHGMAFQKIWVVLIKSMKSESQIKSFQSYVKLW